VLDVLDLHARSDRSLDHLGVIVEILCHPVFCRKRIRVHVLEFQVRKSVVPGRTVGDERVPAHGTPVLRNAAALKNDVRNTQCAEMLAHRDAGLACPNDQGVGGFD